MVKQDSDSSDDEPLVKKKKKSPPTDDEIVSLVKELLDGADLEKITMKSVCKQVCQTCFLASFYTDVKSSCKIYRYSLFLSCFRP